MTKQDKIAIQILKDDGHTTADIAKVLQLSSGAIRTYLSRQGNDRICLSCGAVVEQPAHTRTKKFCSDSCRFTWWKSHSDEINHRCSNEIVCLGCGKTFTSHRSRERKYCCQECYLTARKRQNITDE